MTEADLHPYQRTAIEHILKRPKCALFLEMGLGKTVSTLTAIKKLMYEELEISRVLVIAPKRVAESVWDDECLKWDHLHCLKVSKILGDQKHRIEALRKKADIYVIGRDNVAWLVNLYKKHALPFDMLVIDELSSFKNHQSQRFKALKAVQPYFKRIVGLTGTPAPNGLIDLWAQIYLLDRGERLGKFITRYREDFFTPGQTNGAIVYSYVPRKGAQEAIYRRLEDICMSMKAKDYLDLPGRIVNVIPLEFPKDLKARYEEFEKEQTIKLIEDSGSTEIAVLNAAVLTNKLLQFANGAMYDADGGTHAIHDIKIEAVKELMEDTNGKPVLIAWTFKSDRDRLLQALEKYNPRELKGPKDIADWNDGLIRVMLMHPASGGHGINLQSGGHIIIWFGQTWSLELEQQFNARLDRQGQKEVVIINKLVMKDTVDEDVIKAQKVKDRTQSNLMEAVKARIEKYAKLANINRQPLEELF